MRSLILPSIPGLSRGPLTDEERPEPGNVAAMQAAVLRVARQNAEARLRYLEVARRKSDWQKYQLKLCADSFEFWVDTWLMANPADLGPEVGVVPWVLWPAQIEATRWDFRAMQAGGPWKRRKARRTGETTRQMAVAYWLARFHSTRVTVASRTMNQVDVLGDEETLFGILREIHLGQPDWMRGATAYDKTGVIAFKGGGQIIGLSTHRQTGRSRRSFLGILDEGAAIESNKLRGAYSALKGACTTLIIVENPTPDRKHFSKAISRDIGEPRIHQVNWTGDPFRMRGPAGDAWYSYTKSTMREVDAAAEYLADENAVYDGKLVWDRAAWQVEECPELYRRIAPKIGGLDYGGGGESLSACPVSVLAQEETGWRAWIDFAWQSGDDIQTAPKALRKELAQAYPGGGVMIYADPSGDSRDKQGEPIRDQWIRHSGGLAIISAPYIANTAEGRHAAAKWADKQARAGRIKISPRAEPLMSWMMKAHRYEERKTWEEEQAEGLDLEGGGTIAPRMEKGVPSHLAEALINDIIELRRRVETS